VKILEKLSEVVYIKVIENGFLTNISSSEQEATFLAKEPFSTSRLAIGQFGPAESLLKEIITKTKRHFLQPAPIVIMHQLYKAEGGLSEIEIRVLKELAYGAGARAVHVWQGDELSKKAIESEIYKST